MHITCLDTIVFGKSRLKRNVLFLYLNAILVQNTSDCDSNEIKKSVKGRGSLDLNTVSSKKGFLAKYSLHFSVTFLLIASERTYIYK